MMLIRLGTRTIEYKPLADSEAERFERQVARLLARKLLRLADGRDIHSPDTWRAVAEEIGCRVLDYTAPHGPLGEFCPTYSGGGCITYNKAATSFMQVRTLVHELGHFLLLMLGFVPWHEYPITIRYEHGGLGGGWHMRHRLARRVERFVFGF